MTFKLLSGRTVVGAIALAAGLLSTTAQATLINRGSGLIYDTTLNVTWVQNANLAAGSSYDDGDNHNDGMMSFTNASAWAGSLIVDGVSGWRLPKALIASDDGSCDFAFSGTDCGYNVNTANSELAHLFTVDLGNRSALNAQGNPQSPSGLTNTGPFIGLKPSQYWTGTTFAPNPDRAWNFDMNYGYQSYDFEDRFFYGALAVHDGDIAAAVPEPETWGLMLAGLVAIGLVRRAKKAS